VKFVCLNGKNKLIRIHAWVERLQINKDHQGKFLVTGIKLSNKKIWHADVVILALGQGIEQVLQNTHFNLNVPILNKWGVVYSLPSNHHVPLKEQPTIFMKGLGIIRAMPHIPITLALGEWIFPKGEKPEAQKVIDFVKQSMLIWDNKINTDQWEKNHVPIYVQPRPMTLDGLPVLDSRTKGLIILNPSGSQGNTQAPGSAYFAASKMLEQIGRNVPSHLKLPSTVDWKQFELYPGRFKEKY
jgi:glycine/D-amino acid oxidase-like deaminating enzyme